MKSLASALAAFTPKSAIPTALAEKIQAAVQSSFDELAEKIDGIVGEYQESDPPVVASHEEEEVIIITSSPP